MGACERKTKQRHGDRERHGNRERQRNTPTERNRNREGGRGGREGKRGRGRCMGHVMTCHILSEDTLVESVLSMELTLSGLCRKCLSLLSGPGSPALEHVSSCQMSPYSQDPEPGTVQYWMWLCSLLIWSVSHKASVIWVLLTF